MAGLTSCYIIPWPDSSLGRNMYCQSTKAGWISLTGCPLWPSIPNPHVPLFALLNVPLSGFMLSSVIGVALWVSSQVFFWSFTQTQTHTHSLDSKHNGVWDPPPPQRTLVTGTCRITSAVISAVEACVFGACCLPTPHLSNDKAMLC